jgi:hypothetical protein
VKLAAKLKEAGAGLHLSLERLLASSSFLDAVTSTDVSAVTTTTRIDIATSSSARVKPPSAPAGRRCAAGALSLCTALDG